MRNIQILNDEKQIKIMAILNYTPDSFFDGGKYFTPEKFFEQAKKCVSEGADILDIGIASTRPGAKLIEAQKEWTALKPLLTELRKIYPDILISVDTYNSLTAEKCIEHGADIINDISGGQFDSNMFNVIAKSSVYYVLMHTSDIPERMQSKTNYTDVVTDIKEFLRERIEWLENKGFSNIIIDPGFGFGKTIEQNYQLLNCLKELESLQKPILAGLSRKSMIYKKLNTTPQDEKTLTGTVILNTVAVQNGARILRVHDVKEAGLMRWLLSL